MGKLGEHARGEGNWTAVLTEAAVVGLREAHCDDIPRQLLLRFLEEGWGVPLASLNNALTGKTWAHVGGAVVPTRPHRISRVGLHFCPIDGTMLDRDVDREGRLVERCVGCERRRARLCMNCGIRIEGHGWRCPMHAKLAKYRQVRESEARLSDERRAAARKRYRLVNREKKLAYKKEWRRRNPMKVQLQKRRARLRGCGGYATREKYMAYHAAYRAKHREKKRLQALARYYQLHPDRPHPVCLECGVEIEWQGIGSPKKRCDSCNPFAKYREAAKERRRQRKLQQQEVKAA